MIDSRLDVPPLELEADSGETFPVLNPATGERIVEVPRMGAGETRRAIEHAERAQKGWETLLAKDRARILRRWADLVVDRREELARLLTIEQGKPLAESRSEIEFAASFFKFTKLYTVFDVHESEEEALASFRAR